MANGFWRRTLGLGGILGMSIGGIGVLVGLYATYTEDVGAGIFFTFFIIGFVMIFWYAMFRPLSLVNHVLNIGEPAEATILSYRENGSSLQVGGEVPRSGVTLELEVRPNGRPSYHAKAAAFIPLLYASEYTPGKVIHVKFDPNHPQRVVLDDPNQL